MSPHLRPHIRALTGTPVHWFTEVPAVNGIPDVALVRFNQAELRRRRRHELVMPSDVACIRAALALADQPEMTVSSLADATGLSAGLLTRRVLPTLRDAGWIIRTDRTWRVEQRYADPALLLVTIELKLRDWKKALGQALQARVGSDLSWVVLDQRPTRALDNLAHFEVRGVGLALLGRGELQIIHAPRQLGYDPARRAVLAERLLAMRAAGVEVGPERQVFGRILT